MRPLFSPEELEQIQRADADLERRMRQGRQNRMEYYEDFRTRARLKRTMVQRADALVEYRTRHNLTQRELATVLGVANSAISRYETLLQNSPDSVFQQLGIDWRKP